MPNHPLECAETYTGQSAAAAVVGRKSFSCCPLTTIPSASETRPLGARTVRHGSQCMKRTAHNGRSLRVVGSGFTPLSMLLRCKDINPSMHFKQIKCTALCPNSKSTVTATRYNIANIFLEEIHRALSPPKSKCLLYCNTI